MQTHTFTVDDDSHSLRLDVFLVKSLADAPSRTFIKKMIDAGHVLVDDKQVKVHYKVHAGEEIKVDIPTASEAAVLKPEDIPLDIFYDDDSIAVINKQVGLVVHPANNQNLTGTLVNALLYHFKTLSNVNEPNRPGIVHRLDRETSGLILIAKNDQAHVRLARQFEKHLIYKQYIAVVRGEVEFDEGIIDASIKTHPRFHDKRVVGDDDSSKEAITRYRVIERRKGKSLINLYPKTGRTHQLRVHMLHLGHPILGDDKYGQRNSFGRLALHAQSLGFKHPDSGRYMEFTAKTPPDFLKEFS